MQRADHARSSSGPGHVRDAQLHERDGLGAERRDRDRPPLPRRARKVRCSSGLLEDPPAPRPQAEQERAGEADRTEQGDVARREARSTSIVPRSVGSIVVGSGPSSLIANESGLGSGGQQPEQRGDDEQPPVAPAHGPGAEQEQHAVRRQDVADVEQHRVQEADHDQAGRASPEQPAHGLRWRIALPAHDLGDAVPEEQAEHRERAPVDEGRDQPGHHAVERPPSCGKPPKSVDPSRK